MGKEHLEDPKNGEGMTLGLQNREGTTPGPKEKRRNNSRTQKMGMEHVEDTKNGEGTTPVPKE